MYALQLGADVSLEMSTQGGDTIRGNAPGERTAEETLTWRAERAESIRVTAASINKSAPPGFISVTWQVSPLNAKPAAVDWVAMGNRWFARDPGARSCDSSGEVADDPVQQAIACYSRATDDPDNPRRPRWLYQLGDAYRFANEFDSAITAYGAAASALTSSRDAEFLAATFQARGWTHSRLGEWAAAEADFEAALRVIETLRATDAESLALRYDFADARNNRCILDQRAGRLSQAEDCFLANRALAETLAHPPFTSATLNGLGYLARRRGDVEQAIQFLQEALERAERAGATLETSAAHNTLGFTWQLAGEFESAAEQYRSAFALFEASGDRARSAVALANLGTLYLGLGDLERARDAQERALQMYVELGDTRRVALAQANLGTVEFERGEAARAAQLHEAALAVWVARGEARRAFRVRTRLISDYLALGDFVAAQESFDAAAAQIQNIADRPAVAEAWLTAGELALATNSHELAEARFSAALKLFSEMDNRPGLVAARFGLSRSRAAIGRQAEALSLARQAIADSETLRPRLMSLTARASYSRSMHRMYRHAVDLMMATESADDAVQALALAKDSKAASFGPLGKARASAPGEPSAAARLARVVSFRQGQLLAPDLDDAEFARRRSDYFAALSELEDFERSEGATQPSVVNEGANRALGENAVLMTLFLGASRAYGWIETSAGVRHVDLGPAEELATLARAAVRRLGAPNYSNRSDTITTLSDALMPMLAPLEPGQKLFVSPDGPLHQVAFAALTRPVTDGERRALVQDFEIEYSTNGGADTATPNSQPAALIVADPEFAPPPSTPTNEAMIALAKLPGSRAEVAPIRRLLGPQAVTALMGFEATRENLIGAASDRYTLLHLATHGIYDDRVPSGSGLALSRATRDGQPVEWFLNVHDVARLRLNADLVALSGCDTARGELIDGEGFVGLTRAFLESGARRVLSSLWAVSDRSTRELMKAFYEAYLGDQLAPAAALRVAQRHVASQRRWRDPYFWAGFAIISR